jgi:hypothetical protein
MGRSRLSAVKLKEKAKRDLKYIKGNDGMFKKCTNQSHTIGAEILVIAIREDGEMAQCFSTEGKGEAAVSSAFSKFLDMKKRGKLIEYYGMREDFEKKLVFSSVQMELLYGMKDKKLEKELRRYRPSDITPEFIELKSRGLLAQRLANVPEKDRTQDLVRRVSIELVGEPSCVTYESKNTKGRFITNPHNRKRGVKGNSRTSRLVKEEECEEEEEEEEEQEEIFVKREEIDEEAKKIREIQDKTIEELSYRLCSDPYFSDGYQQILSPRTQQEFVNRFRDLHIEEMDFGTFSTKT